MKKLTFALVSLLLGTNLLAAWPLASPPAHAVEETKPSAPTSAAPTEPATDIAAPTLQAAVERFMKQLALQPGFEPWQQASWTSYPLGPGMHGWVIIVSAEGSETGYLVIHAGEPDTYKLTEYGKGSYPLFSLQTLHRSLVQLELIEYPHQIERLYFGPLQALWKITVQNADRIWYIDAKTGEELPFASDAKLPKSKPAPAPNVQAFTNTDAKHTIQESGQSEPAEPYARLPWVQSKSGKPLPFDDLKQLIAQGSKPVYAAELYEGSVTVPLPVAGFQVWSSGDRFVQFRQDDDRFLPYEALQRLGSFYP